MHRRIIALDRAMRMATHLNVKTFENFSKHFTVKNLGGIRYVLTHTVVEDLHISKESAQQLIYFVGEAIKSHWRAVKESSGKPPSDLVLPSGLQIYVSKGEKERDFGECQKSDFAGGAEKLRLRFDSGVQLFRKWVNYREVAYMSTVEVDQCLNSPCPCESSSCIHPIHRFLVTLSHRLRLCRTKT